MSKLVLDQMTTADRTRLGHGSQLCNHFLLLRLDCCIFVTAAELCPVDSVELLRIEVVPATDSVVKLPLNRPASDSTSSQIVMDTTSLLDPPECLSGLENLFVPSPETSRLLVVETVNKFCKKRTQSGSSSRRDWAAGCTHNYQSQQGRQGLFLGCLVSELTLQSLLQLRNSNAQVLVVHT